MEIKPVIFDNTQECRKKIIEQLRNFGCCEVKNVLNQQEIETALDKTWDLMKEMSPEIDRNKPKTWCNDNLPADQRGMIQSMAGWTEAQFYVRNRVKKMYELIYKTKDLDCSADGLTFSGILKVRKKEADKRVHFDQGEDFQGNCIQGVVNLMTQNDGDACFGCYPGSHKLHKVIIQGKGKKNWYLLTKKDSEYLEQNGLKFKRFTLEAGSMMLFFSRTAHSQAHPIKTKNPQKLRIVHYVCMLPKCKNVGRQEKTKSVKRKAYKENRATSHWPNCKFGEMALFAAKLPGRFKDTSKFNKAKKMKLEDMTDEEKSMMGLD